MEEQINNTSVEEVQTEVNETTEVKVKEEVKTFTQEEVDKMISKRLQRERKDIEAKIEKERLDVIPETTLCSSCAKKIITAPDESESMDKNALNSYNDMYYSEYIKDLTDLNKNGLDRETE